MSRQASVATTCTGSLGSRDQEQRRAQRAGQRQARLEDACHLAAVEGAAPRAVMCGTRCEGRPGAAPSGLTPCSSRLSSISGAASSGSRHIEPFSDPTLTKRTSGAAVRARHLREGVGSALEVGVRRHERPEQRHVGGHAAPRGPVVAGAQQADRRLGERHGRDQGREDVGDVRRAHGIARRYISRCHSVTVAQKRSHSSVLYSTKAS